MAEIQLQHKSAQINAGVQTGLELDGNKSVLKQIGETDGKLTFKGEPITLPPNFPDDTVQLNLMLKWFADNILPTFGDGRTYLLQNGKLVEVTGGAVWKEGEI